MLLEDRKLRLKTAAPRVTVEKAKDKGLLTTGPLKELNLLMLMVQARNHRVRPITRNTFNSAKRTGHTRGKLPRRSLKRGGLGIITRGMTSRLTIGISKPSQKALQSLVKSAARDKVVKKSNTRVNRLGKRLMTIPKIKRIKNIMKSNKHEVHLLIMHHEMDQDKE